MKSLILNSSQSFPAVEAVQHHAGRGEEDGDQLRLPADAKDLPGMGRILGKALKVTPLQSMASGVYFVLFVY